MTAAILESMPGPLKHCQVSFPAPAVLLVLINRPARLSSLSIQANHELDGVFRWFDNEARFLVAIISGACRTFCVGADLHEWRSNSDRGIPLSLPGDGFGGLSLRDGKKPVIAAVNGPAYGGGCEMVLNCDMVLASASALFALPEVRVGVTALAGVLPRLVRTVGRQRATDLALTGRTATAQEFREWGICTAVVDEGADVVEEAIRVASSIDRS